MSEEIKNEDEKEEKLEPIEVTIKKEETKPEPSWNYDDYLPTTDEIDETEKEMEEITKKRQVSNKE